jgi:ribosomal-protein-alanine N-acetyltransferase
VQAPPATPERERCRLTERFVTPRIRPLRLDDAAELATLYRRNRDFLAPYEPERDDTFFTPAGQERRLEQAVDAARRGGGFRYAIVQEEGRIAGTIALEHVVRLASQSATVGYWVDQTCNGRGLATGAVADLIELARSHLSLHRLQAPVRVDNPASARVLAKNGFERIGVARGFLRVGGAWRDHVLFQKLLD